MEPIEAVYIKEENIPEDNEQEDLVLQPILDWPMNGLQEKKFELYYKQNDDSVEGGILFGQTVQPTLLVRSDVSIHSVSDHSCGSITFTAGPQSCTCAICLQPFSAWDLLMKHVFTHILNVKSPSNICYLCGKVFLNLSMISAHNFHCGKKTIFKESSLFELSCAFCAQTLSWCSLMEHVFSHIPAICAPLYVCTYCFGVFEDMAKLHFHKCTSRTSQIRKFLDRQFNSPILKKQLPVTEHLKNHMPVEPFSSNSYSKRLKSKHFHETILYNEQSPVSEKSYKLSTLFHCFGSREKIHESDPLFYNVNEKSVRDSCRPKEHLKIHLGEHPHSCEVCGKHFTKSWNLKSHKRIHLGERPYTCEICGKSFIQNGHLKSHKRIHLGERPFSCELCGKCFTESGHLKSHVRSHLGVRPFSCEICGKSFIHSSHLKTHNNIHLGGRPFCCEVCGNSFTHTSSLRTHKRIHLGERPFSCEVCGKSFTQSAHLKSHKNIHLGEGTLSCVV